MKKLEPKKEEKEPTERDLLVRRACNAWQRAGYPRVMLAGEESDITDDELITIAAAVDDNGQPVENFRELMQQAWDFYHESRKASADAPSEGQAIDTTDGFGHAPKETELAPAAKDEPAKPSPTTDDTSL